MQTAHLSGHALAFLRKVNQATCHSAVTSTAVCLQQQMACHAGVPAQSKSITSPPSSGVFSLLVLNLAAFVADHLLHLAFMPLLYLNHAAPHWWVLLMSLILVVTEALAVPTAC